MSKRFSFSEKAEILRGFKSRSVSAEEFARDAGVSLQTLYNWRKQVSNQEDSGFMEVTTSSVIDSSPSGVLRITIGCATIDFSQFPEPFYLVSLVQGLNRC